MKLKAPIVLEDHDSSQSQETAPIVAPLEKYPSDTCHCLHSLITPEKLTKLIQAATTQATESLLLASNTSLDTDAIEIDYDLLIESERGFTVFGYPLFSSQILPTDPVRLITPQETPVLSMQLYPLPSDQWKWLWPQWHVVMDAGDTDDQGWCYAWWFRSKNWRGRMKTGIVRRRIWMRVRWRPV